MASLAIGDMPQIFPMARGLERRGIRRRPYRRYGTFYQVEPERVYVVRILHGAREYRRLFGEGDG